MQKVNHSKYVEVFIIFLPLNSITFKQLDADKSFNDFQLYTQILSLNVTN